MRKHSTISVPILTISIGPLSSCHGPVLATCTTILAKRPVTCKIRNGGSHTIPADGSFDGRSHLRSHARSARGSHAYRRSLASPCGRGERQDPRYHQANRLSSRARSAAQPNSCHHVYQQGCGRDAAASRGAGPGLPSVDQHVPQLGGSLAPPVRKPTRSGRELYDL